MQPTPLSLLAFHNPARDNLGTGRHGSPPQPGAADLSFDDEHPIPAATLRHRSHARIATTARRWARAEQPGRRPGALRLGRGLDGVPAVLDRRSRPQWPLRLGRRLDGLPAGSNGSRRQLQPGGNHAYDRLHVVSEWRLRLQSASSNCTPPDPCSRGTARPRPRGAPSSLTRIHRFGSGGRWVVAASGSTSASPMDAPSFCSLRR